jgi:hypothetical protein
MWASSFALGFSTITLAKAQSMSRRACLQEVYEQMMVSAGTEEKQETLKEQHLTSAHALLPHSLIVTN